MTRFRGALLGTVLGHCRAGAASDGGTALRSGKSMVALLRHLGERGADAIPWAELRPDGTSGEPDEESLSLAIASIPLALYYHDRDSLLTQSLRAAATAWNLPQEAILPAHLLAEVLSLALLEELELERVSLQLIEYLELPFDALAAQQLRQLQVAYEERYSWAIAQHHLQSLSPMGASFALPLPLLLALYGFLRSPQDLTLALSLPDHADVGITGALVGAIAGSFNGAAYLPTQEAPDAVTLSHNWGVSHPQDIILLSDQLLAQWAGVYRPVAQPWKGTIAAPHAIRPFF